jgi:hypothetical protein
MSTQEVLAAVIDWLARVKLASLELPLGWFGRPEDNLRQLTWSGATEHKLLLEFDGQLMLIITDPGSVEVLEWELRVEDSAQVTLDWQEYGNRRPHVDDHGPGTVRLVAQGSALRR